MNFTLKVNHIPPKTNHWKMCIHTPKTFLFSKGHHHSSEKSTYRVRKFFTSCMTHRGLVFTILKVLRTLDTKEYSCLVSLYIHIICFFLVTSAFRQMQTEITFRFRVTPSRIAENNFKNDITLFPQIFSYWLLSTSVFHFRQNVPMLLKEFINYVHSCCFYLCVLVFVCVHGCVWPHSHVISMHKVYILITIFVCYTWLENYNF